MDIGKLFISLFISVLVTVSPLAADPQSMGVFNTEDFSLPNADEFSEAEVKDELKSLIAPGDILPSELFFERPAITMEVERSLDIASSLAYSPESVNRLNVRYESSDRNVASVDKSGLVSANGTGECDISAVCENGKTAVCRISVYCIDVEAVSLESSFERRYAFESFPLLASILPEDASVKAISYSTSNPNVATIDKSGLVTCVLPGNATITATAYGGKKTYLSLTVLEYPVESVSITAPDYQGKKGEKFTLISSVLPENATFKKLTWTSSNPRIASVDENGVVTLRRMGSAIITGTATNGAFSDYTVSCTSTFKSYHFRQGDPAWRFSRNVRKRACVITAYAILLKNLGFNATPRTVYNLSGSTNPNISRLESKYAVRAVCALDSESPYLYNYENGRTFIVSPKTNAAAAIKEALSRYPEGIIAYFSRGDEQHAVVAIGSVDNEIFYSDPGRSYDKGFDVTLSESWVYAGHKMGYANLAYIIALERTD